MHKIYWQKWFSETLTKKKVLRKNIEYIKTVLIINIGIINILKYHYQHI